MRAGPFLCLFSIACVLQTEYLHICTMIGNIRVPRFTLITVTLHLSTSFCPYLNNCSQCHCPNMLDCSDLFLLYPISDIFPIENIVLWKCCLKKIIDFIKMDFLYLGCSYGELWRDCNSQYAYIHINHISHTYWLYMTVHKNLFTHLPLPQVTVHWPASYQLITPYRTDMRLQYHQLIVIDV